MAKEKASGSEAEAEEALAKGDSLPAGYSYNPAVGVWKGDESNAPEGLPVEAAQEPTEASVAQQQAATAEDKK